MQGNIEAYRIPVEAAGMRCDGCGSLCIAYRLTLTNLLQSQQPRARHYCSRCWHVILRRVTDDPQGVPNTGQATHTPGVRKIAINRRIGSFGYSQEAREKYNLPAYTFDIGRDDPRLIQAVEELGDRANNEESALKVVEIPDDVAWKVTVGETGQEWVTDKQRTWF